MCRYLRVWVRESACQHVCPFACVRECKGVQAFGHADVRMQMLVCVIVERCVSPQHDSALGALACAPMQRAGLSPPGRVAVGGEAQDQISLHRESP